MYNMTSVVSATAKLAKIDARSTQRLFEFTPPLPKRNYGDKNLDWCRRTPNGCLSPALGHSVQTPYGQRVPSARHRHALHWGGHSGLACVGQRGLEAACALLYTQGRLSSAPDVSLLNSSSTLTLLVFPL